MKDTTEHFYSEHEHIGGILIKRKLISPEQLEEALQLQEKEKVLLGEILVKQGFLEELDIVVALIVQCNLPYIAIGKYAINKEVLKLIPKEVAEEFHLIPLDRVGKVLSVVMADPLSKTIRAKIAQISHYRIATFIATKSEIDEAVALWYGENN